MSPRAHSGPLHLVLGAALVLLLVASARVDATDNGLQPVPFPDLSHLEARVARQLREMEALWRPVLEDLQASAAQRIEAYGELGMLYHAYQLENPARVCYRNAERLAPREFRWPYLLGVLHQQAGRPDQAEQSYRRALEHQPTFVPALIRLAQLRLLQNRLEEAETLLQRALQESPGSVAAVATLGEVALAGRRFEAAVEYLNNALRAVPSANRLHYPLAMAYRGLGKLDMARQHLAQRGEVGLKPKDPLVDGLAERVQGERVHLLRGQRAFRAGRYQEAAQAFAEAVAAQPESVRARINFGSALASSGNRSGAIAQYRTALRLAPENVTAHYNLGHMLALDGVIDGAIDHLRAAITLQPTDQQALLELAQALRRAGELDEAMVHFGRVVELAPMNAAARLEETAVLVQIGRYRLALRKLQEAHQLMPEDGRLAHALARLLGGTPDLGLRDGARALNLAQRVFKARATPGHAETVAMALAEIGRCEAAAEWQRRALAMGSETGPVSWLRELVRTLRHYEQNQPCRYPARGD
ncbi:MAG: tetratricopeptide repeat protein [Planctomycetota bacterium]